jgi:hypothetical protein
MLNVPLRFVLINLSQYSFVTSTVGVEVGFTPAQLKMWFMVLYFSITEVMKVLQEETEDTSKVEVKCEPVWQRVSVWEREVGLMSLRARVAPRWESLMAVARPMPEPAPVTIMTWLEKEGGMLGDVERLVEQRDEAYSEGIGCCSNGGVALIRSHLSAGGRRSSDIWIRTRRTSDLDPVPISPT